MIVMSEVTSPSMSGTTVQPENAKKKEWLDHVFYDPDKVTPVKFAMDRSQKALDVSDHSPVIFDFELK